MCKCFFSWRIIVSIYIFFLDLASISDFYLSLLAPISKRGSRTNDDDDGDDEWIMFHLCGDSKGQEVDLLQSGIIK